MLRLLGLYAMVVSGGSFDGVDSVSWKMGFL